MLEILNQQPDKKPYKWYLDDRIIVLTLVPYSIIVYPLGTVIEYDHALRKASGDRIKAKELHSTSMRQILQTIYELTRGAVTGHSKYPPPI